MAYTSAMPSLQVSDLAETRAWYERLFDREPDRRPMDGTVEWDIGSTGGLQLYANPYGATKASVIIGVDDIDALPADLRARDIAIEPADAPSGQFRLAQVTDPAGNAVVLSQQLS